MKKAIIIVMCLVPLLFYCKKEDNIPPVINSVNIQEGDTLRNNFEIKVDASDNSSVSAIEVYANDSLIIKDTKSPLDFNLNTLSMKDGEYTIKTIVYDAKGNKSESSYKVQIQNVLLTINLGSSISKPFQVVISDEQGNILRSVTLLANGKVKIMPQAAFNNNAINFLTCSTNSGFTGIFAYIHVKRGSEYEIGTPYVAPVVNSFKLHLKNDLGSFSEVRISTDRVSYQIMSMSDTINLPQLMPYSTDHKLLIQLKSETGWFYKFFTIQNIQEVTINLSDINQAESVKTYTLLGEGSASLLLQGTSNDADSINRYYISNNYNEFFANHLDIYYPPEYFSKYHSAVSFTPFPPSNPGIHFMNQYRGVIPDSFDPLLADFTFVNESFNNFSANISGAFDFYSINYYDPTLTVELLVEAPVNQKEWKLPDLTTAFGNPAFVNFAWKSIQLTNMGSLDWTNKFFDVGLNLERLNFYETYCQYKWIFNPATNNRKVEIPKNLNSDLHRRLGI
jgi:hypothetical protein